MSHDFQSIPEYIRHAMTPQMRRVVEHQLAHEAARTPVEGSTPFEIARAEYRQERAFWNEGGPSMAHTQDLRIEAAGVRVPVRIHRPVEATGRPAIVYLHGGGFSVGDLDTHDRIMRVLAAESGCAVVAVDYSLSPEARFPQALHECAVVVATLAADGTRYGLDPDRLVLAGDSAGAMLSLGATLLLRDEPQTVGSGAAEAFASIRALLLYYGAYGLRDSASGRLFGGFWDGMGREDLRQVDTVHFTDPTARDSPYADQLGADLTSPMPPALVVGAELDPLVDDSRALATLLTRAGHRVDLHIVPGVLHSFLHFGRMLDAAGEALSRGAGFVRSHV